MPTTPNRPDIFIIGMMKGGTTVLHEFMAVHPQIFAGPIKELHYFSMFQTRGLDWYHANYADLPAGAHYLDSSPSYFGESTSPAVAEKILQYNPAARAILIVRDPIERAVSHFLHLREIDRIPWLAGVSAEELFSRDFGAAINEVGLLDHFLMVVLRHSAAFRKAHTWRRVFGEALLVLENDALRNDPQATMARAFAHVGVEPISSPEFGSVRYNRGAQARNELSPETYEKLRALFAPDWKALAHAHDLDPGLLDPR